MIDDQFLWNTTFECDIEEVLIDNTDFYMEFDKLKNISEKETIEAYNVDTVKDLIEDMRDKYEYYDQSIDDLLKELDQERKYNLLTA